MLEVTLDVSILILLLATIGLGATLHRRLRRLQHDRGELAALVTSLETAVARAEAVLGELRRTALEHGERVDRDQHMVGRLIEDLTVLSARANRDADRLAEQIRVARGAAGSDGPPAAAGPAGKRGSPAAEDLEQALRSLR